MTVSSRSGWQRTSWVVEAGRLYSFQGISGRWSVDGVNLPYVGIEGYSQAADAQIFKGCKMDPNLPYGILLARIGDGPAFTMPPGLSFSAPGSGTVFLRIHDADRCLVDNDGSVTVGLSSRS